MNFRKKEKTGKKSGKFSAERKNGRKEGERENFRKIKIFSKKPDGKKDFWKKKEKSRKNRTVSGKKERNGMMGRAGPDGGRMAGIFRSGRRISRISDFFRFSHRKRHPAGCLFFFSVFGETDRDLFFQSRLFRSRSLSRSEIFCRAYTAPFMVRMLCIPISI